MIIFNGMLETLIVCPLIELTALSPDFIKDFNWFAVFIPSTNSVFIIHADDRKPINLYIHVDACTIGVADREAYHTRLPQYITTAKHTICHLEAINAVAGMKTWSAKFSGKLVNVYCNNVTEVSIFYAGHSRDAYPQACARQLWLTIATYDITLGVGDIHEEKLTSSVNALSR